MLKCFTRLLNKIGKMEQQKLPLVVILGATGCGKTKLSLELAQKFDGEIVGADSMQIYKGLDILTAKATEEERRLVPHHLIDELDPHEECNAYSYRNKALTKIDEIFSKNKLPIVVGGTNYYIESLLFKILVDGTNLPGSEQLVRSLEEKPSEELHKMLQEVDPERAQTLHPQDKRKIVRSLEVYNLMGCKHSKLLKEQQTSEGGSSWGGGLRFPNSLILWLECDQTVLDERLDLRVESMIEDGLVDELQDFHHRYNQHRLKSAETTDYTKGIFQSIGLKDFHNYLLLETEAERDEDDGRILFQQAVEQLKTATRRYARKQKRWIVNRFLSKGNREVPPVYSLDTTDVEQWQEKVGLPGQEIVQSYLDGSVCLHEALPKRKTNARSLSDSKSHFCEPCQRVFIGNQWMIHLKSHTHKRVLARKAKQAKFELIDKSLNCK